MILDEIQVKAIFERQYAIYKKLLDKRARSSPLTGEEQVEPWPGYTVSVERAAAISAHTTPGVYPERLFAERAPNQTPKEAAWIRANYKQTTLPVFSDFSNTIQRGIHPSNWTATIEDAEVNEYASKGIKEFGSVDFFTLYILPRMKINDAMGVIVTMPLAVPTVANEEGEQVIDGSKPINPVPVFYGSDRVIGFDYDEWYLVLSNERSEVTYGRQAQKAGRVFLLIDEDKIWRIAQTGRKQDDSYTISVYYPHGIGECPVIHAQGNPEVVDGQLLWSSPYLAAKDLLDIALLEEHYLRATKAKVMFPHAVMVGDPCDFVDPTTNAQCVGGVLRWSGEDGAMRERTCPTCNGTGHKRRLTPFGELLINADPNAMRPDAVNASNALSFVVPPTTASEFIRREIDANIRQARSIMHLDAEAPMLGGDVKTATQSGLDARAREAFVRPICDQILGIHEFILSCIGRMMRGPQWDGLTMTMPSQYDVRDEADVFADLQVAVTSGLPPVVVAELIRESVRAMGIVGPGIEEAIAVDRLAPMSEAVIRAEAAAGRIEPWELLLHYGAAYLLTGINTEENIGEALIAAAKVAASVQPSRTPAVDRLIRAIGTQPAS